MKFFLMKLLFFFLNVFEILFLKFGSNPRTVVILKCLCRCMSTEVNLEAWANFKEGILFVRKCRRHSYLKGPLYFSVKLRSESVAGNLAMLIKWPIAHPFMFQSLDILSMGIHLQSKASIISSCEN